MIIVPFSLNTTVPSVHGAGCPEGFAAAPAACEPAVLVTPEFVVALGVSLIEKLIDTVVSTSTGFPFTSVTWYFRCFTASTADAANIGSPDVTDTFFTAPSLAMTT